MTEPASITLPVPPAIATAWQALPPRLQARVATLLVEACLEPLRQRRERRLHWRQAHGWGPQRARESA